MSGHEKNNKVNLKKELENVDKLIENETVESGNVKFTSILEFLRASSILFTSLFLCSYATMFTASSLSGLWLSDWSDSVDKGNEKFAKHERLLVYAAIGFSQHMCSLMAECFSINMMLRSSRHLHKLMLTSLMRSTLQFFESTPIGRIINRFSKDMNAVEFVIPISFKDFSYCCLDVLASVILISYVTPFFLIVLVPIFVIYFFIQRYYVASCSKLKRQDAVTKSPIFSHVGETLNGIATIKAYKAQERFISIYERRLDENNEFFYPSSIIYSWLAIHLEILGNMITVFAAIFAIVGRDNITAGQAGLSITFSLTINTMLSYMVKMTAELESNLTSVERIKEYCNTPSEAEWIVEDNRPPKEWPDKGEIKFIDYSVKYREDLDYALKKINCTILPNEKIGIVGRTGAGKSSLSSALFRLLDKNEGKIVIDNIDIKTIGLHDLRQKLTIIPQDPVLFCGSLRMNLDPFEQYSDHDIWSALEKAHLKPFVQELDEGLLFECTEGGDNLSVGQRQLICLARALLRNTKILLLDEATAAIDPNTDELIQLTIREAFCNCTILTIAHRLNTIMDSTRIMVLDKGCIVEFDTPSSLLANESTLFYSMAQSAGII